MSWYERAKGRRKFRVNEEDEELVQVIWNHDGDGDGNLIAVTAIMIMAVTVMVFMNVHCSRNR